MGADPNTDVELADLVGYTTCVTRSAAGRVALLNSDCDPQFPWWFRLLVRDGDGWDTVLPPDLRLAGPLTWSQDGNVLAVSAFRGIRRGVVAVEPDSGHWWWATPDDEASYLDVAPGAAGRYVEAVRVELDGLRTRLRIDRDGGTVQLNQNTDSHRDERASYRLLRWPAQERTLEGVLAVPVGRGNGPWPLVVELHGGPVAAFQAGDVGHLPEWCARGFAALMPEFRASGILGPDAMWQAFRGDGLPDADPEVAEVCAAVTAAGETGLVDLEQAYLIGHSYGGYLVNRIVTNAHPFRAAVCWEGLADLRLLTDISMQMQSRWRGGSPDELPDVWAAASPVERANRVTVPMLLVYGEHGLAVPHGEAWHAALRLYGAPSEYVVYLDEGHLLTSQNQTDLFDRAAAWFRSASEQTS
ncbi:alpha/beta hydrolase family protein [Actinopolymorpha alba]|uniref:alpha/beta hydrolase family protein n=1 Tax=Actinopolymorpha alba TaxID=533267 RepID=UPI0003761C6A|nr:prolyl oligopeptidase family serine peptidase [Actinopolymorpha alba]